MDMYDYTFRRVDVAGKGIFAPNSGEHREVINKFAKEGYRYSGFIPVTQGAYGSIATMDLIFERVIDGK